MNDPPLADSYCKYTYNRGISKQIKIKIKKLRSSFLPTGMKGWVGYPESFRDMNTH